MHVSGCESIHTAVRATDAQRSIRRNVAVLAPKEGAKDSSVSGKGAANSSPEESGMSDIDLLIGLAKKATVFATPENTGYARIGVNGHHEVWPLRSDPFKRWLLSLYYQKFQRAPSASARREAMEMLEASAHFDSTKEPGVHARRRAWAVVVLGSR